MFHNTENCLDKSITWNSADDDSIDDQAIATGMT